MACRTQVFCRIPIGHTFASRGCQVVSKIVPQTNASHLQQNVQRPRHQRKFSAHLPLIDLLVGKVMRIPIFIVDIIRVPNDDHMSECDSRQRENDRSDGKPVPTVEFLPTDPSEDQSNAHDHDR